MTAGLVVKPIGTIRTPFGEARGTPIQPRYGEGREGTVLVDDAYAGALADIEGFERIWLIYWLDRSGPFEPVTTPFRDTRKHGLFATRSPCRPNPIGLSVVRLLERKGAVLRVADLDILDGTPLLDIKPYVPEFDAHPASRAGWLDEKRSDHTTADGRFAPREGP